MIWVPVRSMICGWFQGFLDVAPGTAGAVEFGCVGTYHVGTVYSCGVTGTSTCVVTIHRKHPKLSHVVAGEALN